MTREIAYAVIYTWGTNGITCIEKKIATIPAEWRLERCRSPGFLIPPTPPKLAHCQINTVDSPASVVPIALSYLRRELANPTPRDLDDVSELLRKIRPYFHNIGTGRPDADAMANGKRTTAWRLASTLMRSRRAGEQKKSNNGINIKYVIPEEGSLDTGLTSTIPKDAPHVVSAHRLINYLMEPKGHRRHYWLYRARKRQLCSDTPSRPIYRVGSYRLPAAGDAEATLSVSGVHARANARRQPPLAKVQDWSIAPVTPALWITGGNHFHAKPFRLRSDRCRYPAGGSRAARGSWPSRRSDPEALAILN